MASASDQQASLKAAMRDTLEAAGQLDNVKAQLRAIVFQALDASTPESRPRPALPPENLIINELIREYLQFNGYEHTASVLQTELGMQSQATVPRVILATQLGLREAPLEVPLLYAMLHEVRERNDAS